MDKERNKGCNLATMKPKKLRSPSEINQAIKSDIYFMEIS